MTRRGIVTSAARVGWMLAVGVALAGCQRPDAAAFRAQMAQTDFTKATTPLLLAEFQPAGAIGLLGKAGVNGPVESWQSPDGVGLSLDRGVLVRTAGSGPGLLIADPKGTLAALHGQGGTYPKLYKHLTGDYQVAEMLFTCQMSAPVAEQITRVGRASTAEHRQERCSSGSATISNDYWIVAGSGVVKSRQWIDGQSFVTVEVPPGSPR